MIVVADSTPLIYLAWIKQLDLLKLLYGTIIVPEAVYREVVDNGASKPGQIEVSRAAWIVVKHCTDIGLFSRLSIDLDEGESEAITLAVELSADQLVIDEFKGRAKAMELEIPVIGTLGILLEAKLKGLIPDVKGLISLLVNETSFRVSEQVLAKVLELANEK